MNEKKYLEFVNQWKEENKELMDSGKCKKIFTENLPKRGKLISWSKSNGYKVYFIYLKVEGFLEIVKLNEDNISVTVKYNELEYIISTYILSKCNIGRILGEITSEFKVKIGTRIKDSKRNLLITDMEYRKKRHGKSMVNEKWYKCNCNKCGWTEGWIEETNLLGRKQMGCSCCKGNASVVGINTIWDTDRWMCDLGVSEEDAKKYTRGSHDKIKVICPDCGKVIYKVVYNIFKHKSISCSCSDKIPYTEKLMFSLLKQLELNFQTQLTKTTFKWCDKYRYDFYFEHNNEQYIIETHGNQHYNNTDNFESIGGKTYEQEVENDRFKKELALTHGIKEENYIVIDCRKSELEWIKDNPNGISNSRLAELFDLKEINWNDVQEFALSNLVKIACEYKRNNPNLTTTEIGKIMGYNLNTICSWLKQGNGIWCNYNAKEELKRSVGKNGKKKSKQTLIFQENICIGIFLSGAELERQSEKLFGVKLSNKGISEACCGKKPQYKGFTFKYVSDSTQEELEKYKQQIEQSKLNQAI